MSGRSDRDPDERLLEQVDEETARLLFPEKFAPESVRVSLVYPPLRDELATTARDHLQAAAELESFTDSERVEDRERERATFTLDHVEELHGLFSLLDAQLRPIDVEILVDGQRLPLVRELWLPLLWTLRD